MPASRWALMRRQEIADLAQPERTYLSRLRIIETPWFGVFIHALRRPDNDRHLHDHPWSFVSVILTGGYAERFAPDLAAATPTSDSPTPGIPRVWGRGSVHRIRRGEFHAITELASPTAPSLTLLLVGPRRAVWGFATEGGFVDDDDYQKVWRS